jgi:pimeloyl-ACP methyl ester carboxylesterase
MATGIDAARGAIRITRALSPRLGATVALSAFFSTRPRLRLHPRDAATMREAVAERLTVRGKRLVAYRWGDAGAVVVLAHGWRGRVSPFAPLVRELVDAGFRVLAFDAPAHGDSAWARTDVRDWLAALAELQARHGRFRLVVGHSFGGFAALTAARQGLETDAVAMIAGAGAPAVFLDEFGRMMRLDATTRVGLEQRFLTRLGDDTASFAARYDGLAHPLSAAVPLLLVHGTADRQLPPSASLGIHEAHPDSRLLLVEGAGHSRVLTDPAVIAAVVDLARDAVEASARRGGTR